MVYPDHMRIVFRGIVKNTPEIWSMSLKYDHTVVAGRDAELEDISANGVYDAGSAFFSSGLFDTDLQWEEWRAYRIGPNGRMVGNQRIELFDSGDFVVGAATPKYPPQVTCCVTTVAQNNGPAKFGRFFLPCFGLGMGGDKRLSIANADGVAAQASTFVKDVSAAVDLPTNPANAAMVNVSKIGDGTKQDVHHLEVGRVLDTQRRRRNALLEERVSTGAIDW